MVHYINVFIIVLSLNNLPYQSENVVTLNYLALLEKGMFTKEKYKFTVKKLNRSVLCYLNSRKRKEETDLLINLD